MTDEAIINPLRGKNEPALPNAGLLFINPPDASRISSLLKSKNASSHFLFNSRLFTVEGEVGNDYFVSGPSVGAPMAVMTLEKLIVLGAKRIIMYGWCGSLSRDHRIGTLLLPTWSIPGEGTSCYYPGKTKPESTEKLHNQICNYLGNENISYTSGPVWSTDAVYRETRPKLDEIASKSVVGVDMEFSALARVAEFRGVEFAAVLLVSDELWHEKWVPGFREASFKSMNKKITTGLLEVIETLGSTS